MNLQFYLEKLYASKEFKKFKKENHDAFLCSAFFIIDLENIKNPNNKQHFDFYIPSLKKMFSFQLEEDIKKVPVEMFREEVPKEISTSCDFDLEEIKEIITNKLNEEKIKNKIQKILLSLQKLKDKDYLICTVFISALGLIKVNIDLSKNEITEFEKKSFMDMMKIVKRKKS